MIKIKCENCGVINEEDALYCKGCGTLLEKRKKMNQEESKPKKQKAKVKKKVKTKKRIKKVRQRQKNSHNQNGSFGKSLLIFFLVMVIIGLLGVSLIMGYHIYNEQRNIEVPNLYHLSYEQAELLLAKKGLKIAKKEQKVDTEEDQDLIISQSKQKGVKVSKNTTIKVVVGKYVSTYVMENFIGDNIDLVKNTLNHQNILYNIVEQETNNEENNDIVISQKPKKGTKMNKGDKVEIIIGKYKKPEISDEDNQEQEKEKEMEEE